MDSQAVGTLPTSTTSEPRERFTRYAWALLGYTLLVILFGAVVRITGSGAGCGQHWPSCNGELLQVPRTLKTAIEYTHRATSGISVVAILGLLVFGFRLYPERHAVRSAAVLAGVMIIVEALIGAMLVKFHLVENDASIGRALVLPLHLSSTALLTAALAWCAYFASQSSSATLPLPNGARALLILAGLAVLVVSATGAVTALGDTVYPVHGDGLAARLLEDQGASAHLLQRMRGIHPLLALAVAAFVAYVAMVLPGYRTSRDVKRFSLILAGCVAMQVLAGALNVWLSAPGYMQITHLLLANFSWIALILLAAAARAAEPNAR
ncbi:MAG TPA: COX15/CtaA family protein [Polyangiaceae bacterium]|jgi:heme A synthase|nr:COX15/CtaA family protein [Polyangiaceae bacterium]